MIEGFNRVDIKTLGLGREGRSEEKSNLKTFSSLLSKGQESPEFKSTVKSTVKSLEKNLVKEQPTTVAKDPSKAQPKEQSKEQPKAQPKAQSQVATKSEKKRTDLKKDSSSKESVVSLDEKVSQIRSIWPAESAPIVDETSDSNTDQDSSVDLLEKFGLEQQETKQQAIAQFMQKMQDQFGVPPQKIVEAFTHLDQATLKAPPEEAMEKLIGQLNLPIEDQVPAKILYQDLVAVTNEADTREKFSALDENVKFEVVAANDQQPALARPVQNLDVHEAMASQLNLQQVSGQDTDSLAASPSADDLMARMNSEIIRYMNEKQAAPVNLAPMNPGIGNQVDDMMIEKISGEDDLGLGSDSENSAISTEGLLEDGLGAGKNASELVNSTNSGQAGLQASRSSFEANMSEEKGRPLSNVSVSSRKNLMGQVKNSSPASSSFAKSQATGAQGFVDSAQISADNHGADLIESNAAPSPSPLGSATLSSLTGGAVLARKGAAAEELMSSLPTSKDEAGNMREIVKQSQLLLKNGGGEMKLEMSPEGMGQLHLKVSVEGGQVSVQMLTESDSAKKMIENGLHDLKASLVAHKLQVEKMQIDVGQEVSKHLDQNSSNGQDSSRENARQMARDFLGGFKQERENFRQMAGDGRGARGYARPQNSQQRVQMMPEPLVKASAAGRLGGGDRRLNLVA
jgi:flagellar hook-length control protein FliK